MLGRHGARDQPPLCWSTCASSGHGGPRKDGHPKRSARSGGRSERAPRGTLPSPSQCLPEGRGRVPISLHPEVSAAETPPSQHLILGLEAACLRCRPEPLGPWSPTPTWRSVDAIPLPSSLLPDFASVFLKNNPAHPLPRLDGPHLVPHLTARVNPNPRSVKTESDAGTCSGDPPSTWGFSRYSHVFL